MAMTFVLTTRGIPEIYYGSEILLTTGADKGHGVLRRDFPGGWPTDERNAFTEQGRTDKENDMFNFVKNLLNYRKSSEVLQAGSLRHFIPQDGIYTYFRYNLHDTVMVAMNNNEVEKTFETRRYVEFLKNHKTGTDIISGQTLKDLSNLTLQAKSAMVIELK